MILKRVLFLIVILTYSVGLFAGGDFKITTLNCQFYSWESIHVKYGYSFRLKSSDKRYWSNKKRTEKFNEQTEKFVKLLSGLGSDVFVLTEVGTAADLSVFLARLSEENPEYKYSFAGDTKDWYTKQNIWVVSKYPLTDIRKIIPGKETYLTEPDRGEENSTEITKGVSFDLKKDGVIYAVFGVHFKSEVGGWESDLKRLGQARIVRRNILGVSPEKIVIVAGDLNDLPVSDVLLTIRGIKDIYYDLIQTGNYKYNKGNRSTYIYQNEGKQIDHILIDDRIEDLAKRGGIDTFITETDLSDHNALTVKIRLK